MTRIRWSSVALTLAVLLVTDSCTHAADRLRIGVQYGLAYLPFYVGERDNLFEQAFAAHGLSGVQMDLVRFSGPPALNEALLSGHVDMAIYGTPALVITWDRTRGTTSEVIGVAGIVTMPYSMVTLRPGLRTLTDIDANDRIATPSTISACPYTLRMLAERRLGRANAFDEQLVAMPNPDALVALLKRTEVTAICTTPPFTDYAMRQPGAYRVLSSVDVFAGPSTSFVLVASRRYADLHPNLVEAVIAALDAANATIAREPRRAADIYLSNEPSKVFDAAFITTLLLDGEHRFNTDVLGIMTYVDYLGRHSLIKRRPTTWKDLFLPAIHGREGS